LAEILKEKKGPKGPLGCAAEPIGGGVWGSWGTECSLSHIDLITEDTSVETLSLAGLKLSAALQHVCECVTWFAQGKQMGLIAGHGTRLEGTSLVCVLSTVGLG